MFRVAGLKANPFVATTTGSRGACDAGINPTFHLVEAFKAGDIIGKDMLAGATLAADGDDWFSYVGEPDEKVTGEVAVEQFRAWIFIRGLLTRKWNTEFEEHRETID